MGASGGGGKKKMLTEINVTPFVDVVLVLLVIFMVTATYIVKGAIPLKLPEASTASASTIAPLILSVDAEGAFLIDKKKVSDEELADEVRAALAENPEVEAVIRGDRRVQYGRVMELIDLVRSLGVKRFAAEVERKTAQ